MPIGSVIIRHEKVSSTNSVAAELLKRGDVTEGTVVITDFQEAGRGQQGNSWESDVGKNLLLSIILYPTMIKPEKQFDICRIISLGVLDTLAKRINDVTIKWPNDIYVKSDKIAGILIENSIMGSTISSSIIGIGLNVNQDIFRSNAPNPVSLKNVTGRETDTEELLKDLCASIDNRYAMLRNGRRKKLSTDYKSSLFRLGEWNIFRDIKGEFTGRIEDVRESGLLAVKKKNGRVTEYAFKEIEYVI